MSLPPEPCSHQWKPFNFIHDIYACIHCDERITGTELVRKYKDATPRLNKASNHDD